MTTSNVVRLAIDSYEKKNRLTRGGVSEIAKKLGVQRITVYRWIKNGEVSLDKIEDFARLTGANPADLSHRVRRLVDLSVSE